MENSKRSKQRGGGQKQKSHGTASAFMQMIFLTGKSITKNDKKQRINNELNHKSRNDLLHRVFSSATHFSIMYRDLKTATTACTQKQTMEKLYMVKVWKQIFESQFSRYALITPQERHISVCSYVYENKKFW